MNQNSWITPGIITYCKHKRELYKVLENNSNNNATVVSYCRDYTKIQSVGVGKAKIIEHDKLILNSQNKVKTTCSTIHHQNTSAQYISTINQHNTSEKYISKIQHYNTSAQYMGTIRRQNTSAQCVSTIHRHNASAQ